MFTPYLHVNAIDMEIDRILLVRNKWHLMNSNSRQRSLFSFMNSNIVQQKCENLPNRCNNMPNANASKVARGQRLPVVIIVATFGQMSCRNASNRCCLTALSTSSKKHRSVPLRLHIVALLERRLKVSVSLWLNAQTICLSSYGTWTVICISFFSSDVSKDWTKLLH